MKKLKTEMDRKQPSISPNSRNHEGFLKLAGVNIAINITNKILDRQTSLKECSTKLNIIPFKNKDGNFYLYDKRKETFGTTPYRDFSRNKEYLIVQNSNRKNLLLRNGEFLFEIPEYGGKTFSLHEKASGPPPFIVVDNEYIVIYYFVSCGGKYITGYRMEIECVFDLKGNILDIEMTDEKLEELVKSENDKAIHISNTLWRVEDLTLKYRDLLIEFNSRILYLSVRDFHYGYAEVFEVWDDDPEYGGCSSLAGLIDIEGNFYWHASQATLF